MASKEWLLDQAIKQAIDELLDGVNGASEKLQHLSASRTRLMMPSPSRRHRKRQR